MANNPHPLSLEGSYSAKDVLAASNGATQMALLRIPKTIQHDKRMIWPSAFLAGMLIATQTLGVNWEAIDDHVRRGLERALQDADFGNKTDRRFDFKVGGEEQSDDGRDASDTFTDEDPPSSNFEAVYSSRARSNASTLPTSSSGGAGGDAPTSSASEAHHRPSKRGPSPQAFPTEEADATYTQRVKNLTKVLVKANQSLMEDHRTVAYRLSGLGRAGHSATRTDTTKRANCLLNRTSSATNHLHTRDMEDGRDWRTVYEDMEDNYHCASDQLTKVKSELAESQRKLAAQKIESQEIILELPPSGENSSEENAEHELKDDQSDLEPTDEDVCEEEDDGEFDDAGEEEEMSDNEEDEEEIVKPAPGVVAPRVQSPVLPKRLFAPQLQAQEGFRSKSIVAAAPRKTIATTTAPETKATKKENRHADPFVGVARNAKHVEAEVGQPFWLTKTKQIVDLTQGAQVLTPKRKSKKRARQK